MCTKKNISDNIKLLMSQKNIKAWSELAKICGLTVPAMQRLINQTTESPGINSLKAIADYFKISVDQLISQTAIVENINEQSDSLENQVPMFDDLSIHKWLRIQNSIKAKGSDNKVRVDDINVSEQTFAYKVLENNLSPIIPENSILVVDTERKIKNKDYVLLKYPNFDKIIIRQILTDGMDQYTIPIVSAYNNTPHEKLSNEVTIIGVVVKIAIYLR